jgi:hypothetical protein
MPEGMNLRISNSLGDVFLDKCDGSVNISVSHGNLSAGKLTRGNIKPVNSISADFGNISVGEANWITITAINCPLVNLGMVQAAVITSRFSRISAGMANSLVCDSKSDMFSIESVNNVVLQSSYTSFVTGDLKGQMVAETNYGSVVIGELSKDFSLVDLKSLQTPVVINVQNDASFTADMSFTGSAIDIPFESNPSLRRQSVNGMTIISGLWGNKPVKNSIVRINAHGGSIQVNGQK